MAKRKYRIDWEKYTHKFWSRVDVGGPNDCRPWIKGLDAKGYGRTFFAGRRVLAHRVALFLSGRLNPDRLHALHSCNNPPCCNPAHLRWGTQKENIRQAAQDGRFGCRKGELSPRAILTDAQALEIRASPETSAALARRFGVSRTAVYMVRAGRSFTHI